jgi:hypothetical protein
MVREVTRAEVSMGNFTKEGILQNLFTKFFLFVLLSLCRLNFVCGDVLRELF